MRCPFCRSADSRVIDSREIDGLIRRRRECPRCHQRFTTHERLAGPSVMVVKKDGRREAYDRAKLMRGMQLACTKLPIATAAIESAIEAVEVEIFSVGEAEVDASRIGEAVLAELRKIDPVAAIRFAAVYQEFSDLDTLRRAIEVFSIAPGATQPATPFAVAGNSHGTYKN